MPGLNSPAMIGLLTIAAFAAVLLVLSGVFLFPARSLVRRELAAYFLSPIAYVVFVVFLALTGFLAAGAVDLLTEKGPVGVESPLRFMFGDPYFWLVFLFIPPVLTMRAFSEERASGTLEVLMTSPLREWQIVAAKYVACLAFYVLLWLPTLAYLPVLLDLQVVSYEFVLTPATMLIFVGVGLLLAGLVLLVLRVSTGLRLVSVALVGVGALAVLGGGLLHYQKDETVLLDISAGLDPAPVLTFYLGIFLAGAMFLAIGLFVSSLVRDQLVAALISLAVSLPFVLAAFLKPDLDSGGLWDRVVYFFSVPLHFSTGFTRGLLDTRPLVLYGSVTLLCLFLTVRSLESRRWR